MQVEAGAYRSFFQCIHRGFLDPLKFLVDVNRRSSGGDAFIGNIHAVPCQRQQFTDTQGAGKRQVQAKLQPRIIAAFNRLEQRRCVPDLPLLSFMLGQGGIARRILFDQIPFLCLCERTPQEIMNFLYSRCSYKSSFPGVFLLAHLLNGRYFLQCLIILLQRAGRYLAQLQFTDNWLDVVPDQASIAGICGDRPFRFPIQLHIALHSTNATSFLFVDSVLLLWYNHFRKM